MVKATNSPKVTVSLTQATDKTAIWRHAVRQMRAVEGDRDRSDADREAADQVLTDTAQAIWGADRLGFFRFTGGLRRRSLASLRTRAARPAKATSRRVGGPATM